LAISRQVRTRTAMQSRFPRRVGSKMIRIDVATTHVDSQSTQQLAAIKRYHSKVLLMSRNSCPLTLIRTYVRTHTFSCPYFSRARSLKCSIHRTVKTTAYVTAGRDAWASDEIIVATWRRPKLRTNSAHSYHVQ
jgi:hypothetical protein